MLGADQRGQAIQIGAIILFSFAVIAFSLYQATVVPDQNAQVEFNHNQEVQQDMLELRGSVLSAGTSGSGTATTVQLGAQYPARIIAVNPGAPSGSLRTVDPGGGSTVTIANAEAQDPETADFWSGTGTPREYTTHGLRYQPNYNEYRQAPETVYENTVVYNRGPDGGASVQTGQRLVSGREIDLTVLLGSYQADQSGSVSVDVSSPANEPRTVAVQANGDPINITVPTSLSASVWADILEPEFVDNGGYIDGSTVSVRGGILSFELRETDADGPITYELRVPAVGIGTGVPDPTAEYVTTVSGNGTSIPEGGTQQVIAEVRNEFNGPESGVSTCVGLSSSSPGSVSSNTPRTDEEGRVSFVYEAPDNVDQTRTATVVVGFGTNGCDGSGDVEPGSSNRPSVAAFEIDVLNTGDGSDGPVDYLRANSGTAVERGDSNTFAGARFNLENRDSNTRIQGILNISVSVVDTPNSNQAPDAIFRQGTTIEAYEVPVYVEGSNSVGYIDRSEVAIGNAYAFDQEPDIDAGSTIPVYLNRFQRARNNQPNENIDMTGAELEITVYYVVDGRIYSETETVLLDQTTTI